MSFNLTLLCTFILAAAMFATEPVVFNTRSSASGKVGETVEPLSIIFDTDMGADCDDVGALFILHGAIERGEVKVLATIGCTSSDLTVGWEPSKRELLSMKPFCTG